MQLMAKSAEAERKGEREYLIATKIYNILKLNTQYINGKALNRRKYTLVHIKIDNKQDVNKQSEQ